MQPKQTLMTVALSGAAQVIVMLAYALYGPHALQMLEGRLPAAQAAVQHLGTQWAQQALSFQLASEAARRQAEEAAEAALKRAEAAEAAVAAWGKRAEAAEAALEALKAQLLHE